MKIKNLDNLETIKNKGIKLIYPDKLKISVGMATCGLATGAQEVYDELENSIRENKLDAILTKTGCLGFCQKEPLVDVFAPGLPRLTYCEMTQDKAKQLINSFRKDGVRKDDLLCKFEEEFLVEELIKRYDISGSNGDLSSIPRYQEVPFFAKQKKIALRNCGFINPDSIEEYIARDGYQSLYKVLTKLSPEQTIEEVKKSGLRGRGGVGFPTGLKWEFCRKVKESPKYVICNAHEGDPGSYGNKLLIESDPHSVIEGMIIGAYAVEATKGYIYIDYEYHLAIERLKKAINSAKEYGLLGENILGAGFNFDIQVVEGQGAYICGEETSLIEAIESNPPEPRARPPFPAQLGIWKKPTVVNNVESWANVPVIIERGASWFSEIGTDKSKGTKVLSLSGNINNNGLVEVPMGTSLKEVIFEMGGGIPDGKNFKAAQTGGPLGGFIPASLIDVPVDYEHPTEIGSPIGSGGIIIIDEDSSVLNLAKFLFDFIKEESCGRCTSCREGSAAILEVLTRISEGRGKNGDIEFLKELSTAVKDASLCGLGQGIPTPILSSLRHFRGEYETYIKNKRGTLE